MRDVALPISILLGFAMLSAAIHTKENDFQTCVRLIDAALPADYGSGNRELAVVDSCQAK
ncbi:hypothetical protein ASD32_07210 [Rhizobium sp. Root483D2]|nr:hypothetical protein ASD32_07210 [Rhizobium sp. Root483D2]